MRQKFTGSERDGESGLDYMQARYYSFTQGRFTSVDPENASANPGDPQSWNGYAYSRNNPLLYTDPDGQTYLIRRPDGTTELLTDEQFNQIKKNPNNDTLGVVVKDGHIYNRNENGDLVSTATYERVAFDDFTPGQNDFVFGLARFGPAMEKTILAFTAANLAPAVIITGSGAVVGSEITTLGLEAGLKAAPLLPAVPSAIDKLRNLGISLEQANEIVQSPASQKLIDKANGDNINVIQEIGGKLIRITLDPTSQRIISAGIVRANQMTNGIANGRFVKK